VFEASDGYLVIATLSESYWPKLCRAIGRPELAGHPDFADNARRVAHRAEVDARVAAEFARHSRAALAERLKSAEIAFGNFNTVEDFSRHPHLRRITAETPQGPVRLPPAPAIFEDERQPGRVPSLGEHTAAVRAEFAA
jgi:crotonobetainyl-CoA:carnitine CoA-transferase CaiB-like acyl-CoA transferase